MERKRRVKARSIGAASLALGAIIVSGAARSQTQADSGLQGGAQKAERPFSVKVAAVQCASNLGDVEGNRARLTRLIEQAAGNGAKIVVLPEAAVTGYLSQDLHRNWQLRGWPIEPEFQGVDPTAYAETVNGPSVTHFRAVARRLHIYLTVPFIEKAKPTDNRTADSALLNSSRSNALRFFNTVCLVSPEGRVVAHHRKLTPWPFPEKSWATPGDRGVQTYDTEYGRVGLAICYDIHTILPKYAPRKLWALLYPIAWVDTTHPAEWFWHKLPARIKPFHHYVIGANWSVDSEQPWYGYGFSTIIGPDGDVLASAKSLHGSEIVYATLKTAWALDKAAPPADAANKPIQTAAR